MKDFFLFFLSFFLRPSSFHSDGRFPQDLLHVVGRRHAVHRAQPGAAEARRGVGVAQDVGWLVTPQHGVDEGAAKHIAGTGGVHGLDLERRHVVQAIAVEQDGPARAERDAKPPVVAPPDLSQRSLGIRFAGQRRRDVLRENGNGHRRNRDLPCGR